jgi:hypothetical protein
MDILQEIETEVQRAADEMNVEVILMLLDKLEANYRRELAQGKISAQDALSHYVHLKICLHHLRRKMDNGYFEYYPITHAGVSIHRDNVDRIFARMDELKSNIKYARRDYYVAKRRVEGQHQPGCACRGCRCLEEFPSLSSE